MAPMAARRSLDRSFTILGGSMPLAVALLIGLTLLASIAGAQAPALRILGSAMPAAVLSGQVWRLVTWVLFERDPLNLIFGALALFWFGGELVRLWGAVRFLYTYFGLAVGAGLATCALALVWSSLGSLPYLGPWPVIDALIIAWASLFPARQVFLYFVLPLRGRSLVYATLGGTLLFALLTDVPSFVPHFAAELLMLASLKGTSLRELWVRFRYEWHYQRWRRRASKLRAVPPASRDERSPWLH
jgi:membrane associated rhomboid family serine protease